MQNIPQLSPHSFLAAQPAKQFDASPQDFPARLRDLPVDSSHTLVMDFCLSTWKTWNLHVS